MRIISTQIDRLRTLLAKEQARPTSKSFVTGLRALDALPPREAFAQGAIHEILLDPTKGIPRGFALLLATRAAGARTIAWCDPRRELYPPALAAAGLPLDQLLLLRPRTVRDELWAVAECLRCRGIGATIAAVGRLSRVEARRLQLAAERGGGVGVLLRPTGAVSANYAAATRWLVRPAPGSALFQRWSVQLVHGHGGLVGKTIFLEVCRDTHQHPHHVRATDAMADRPDLPQTAKIPA